MIASSLVQYVLAALGSFISKTFSLPTDPETPVLVEKPTSKKIRYTRLPSTSGDSTLAFTLYMCFAFASVSQMSSLLIFDPRRGEAACGKN
jgi:hypothetical protein